MTSVLQDPSALRAACDQARAAEHRVGCIPTMGALHAGHLALVEAARSHGATFVVVTVFVNPIQFGPDEDFEHYPRTLEMDVALCRDAGVDVVFAPSIQAMFPKGFQTFVDVSGLAEPLEGAFRPGHFRGVTTIVTKLLNLCGPCLTVFGRKDYQQWKVVERMVHDLDMPVTVAAHPTVREADGLALSSRNRRLSSLERRKSLAIVHGLRRAAQAFSSGERHALKLLALAREPIEQAFDRIDYVALVDADTFAPIVDRVPDAVASPATRALLAVAAHIGSTRLIDNVVLGEDELG